MTTVLVEHEGRQFLFDADQGVVLHHCSSQFDTEAEAALICALAQIRCEIRANRGTLEERVANLEDFTAVTADSLAQVDKLATGTAIGTTALSDSCHDLLRRVQKLEAKSDA